MATQLTYVSAPDCHLCERGRTIVHDLAEEASLDVVEVGWSDASARGLTERDGVPFPPALYLDDRLLGYGRLSERRLRKQLTGVVPV